MHDFLHTDSLEFTIEDSARLLEHVHRKSVPTFSGLQKIRGLFLCCQDR